MSGPHGHRDDAGPTGGPTDGLAGEATASAVDGVGDGVARYGYAAGTVVGRYVIRSTLGEGGFGVVYRAEQTEPVRREVALKVIKPGMDSKAVVARFEAERQALALMDHPCVAKVFDGGVTDRGLPFFVMELVKGEPITSFCDRERMSIEARVSLFAKVCEAVEHAHGKGVVHRDLKPSNILVEYRGDEAVPTVIDFGVAKALNQRLTEATVFTERGQMIGTPEYMSPEQAEMSAVDIDTRSDVYSLGVVLYELLTGFRPFDLKRAGLAEMQRVIREVEPVRPSTRLSEASKMPEAWTSSLRARGVDARTLTSTLRRDLDWVVMRCLEKDRARRYGGASLLRDELARYLAGEAVLAGPPGVAYRVSKLVSRRRVEVMFAAGVLLVGGVAGAWSLRERGRAAAADETRLVAQAQADELEASLEAVRSVQRDLRSWADAEASARAAIEAEDTLLRSDFSGRASEELVRRLALAEQAVREKDWMRALRHGERAKELLGLVEGVTAVDRLGVASRLGVAMRQRGMLLAAVEAQREALSIARGLDDPGQVAVCEYNLANALRSIRAFEEAERLYVSTLGYRKRAYGEGDAKTLLVHASLASMLGLSGRVGEAEALLDRAIATSLSVEGSPRIMQLRLVRVSTHVRAGEYDEAESLASRIAADVEAFGGGWVASLALARARAARGAERWRDVEAFARQGLEVQAIKAGGFDATTLDLLVHWALALDRLGRGDAAGALIGACLRHRAALVEAGDPGLAMGTTFIRASATLDELAAGVAVGLAGD